MSWVDAIWPVLVALALTLIPGALIGYSLGFRRITLMGLAPVFSLTVIGLTPIALGAAHIRWGILPVVIATLILTAVGFLLRRALSRWMGPTLAAKDRGMTRWAAAGVAVAALAIGARMVAMIGVPSNISQTYDNVFHLNTIRYILDSGIASSLSLSGFPPSGLERAGFYPAGWHDLTSLVAQVSGASIPVTVSAVTLVIGAVLWPLGFVFLVRTIAGARRFTLVASGIIAAGMAGFPYLMMDFGVLYPFLLGLSLLPAVWALCIHAMKLGRENSLSFTACLVALAFALPGISLAHPSATTTLIVLCGPLVLVAMIRRHREMAGLGVHWPRIAGMYVLAAAGLGLVGVLFRKIQPGNVWKPESSWPDAFLQLLLTAPAETGVAIVSSILLAVGLVVLVVRRSTLWLPLSWLVFAILFLVGAAASSQRLRVALIGLWYGDVFRVTAILTIVGAPLMVLGLVWLTDRMRSRIVSLGTGRVAPVTAGVTLLVTLLATQLSNLPTITELGREDYAMNAQSKLLTPDEEALLNLVDEFVPVEKKIIGNPWTGTPLVYAYSNRVPVLSRPGVSDLRVSAVSQRLQYAASDPAVCEEVAKYDIGFVLDFGDEEVHEDHHEYSGLRNLNSNPSVVLVKQIGAASLWKITACSSN